MMVGYQATIASSLTLDCVNVFGVGFFPPFFRRFGFGFLGRLSSNGVSASGFFFPPLSGSFELKNSKNSPSLYRR